MAETVKEFLTESYQLISASSPTTPLHGNDMLKGVKFLNQLLQSYSASGLLITVAKRVQFTVAIGQSEITFGAADFVPTPDVTTEGRLANLNDAWLELEGVTYPLIDKSRDVFFQSYKYDPQLGLPRFCIITNETNLTRMRIYPGASQVYTLNVFGKFQLPILTENSDLSILPEYYKRYLSFAVARDLAFYKGRSAAWTEKLQEMLELLSKEMESVSAVNLLITSPNESYLNGSWRVRAGV